MSKFKGAVLGWPLDLCGAFGPLRKDSLWVKAALKCHLAAKEKGLLPGADTALGHIRTQGMVTRTPGGFQCPALG